ncbi:MAG: 3-methyl-2-oxobutanoate hydroxymethyltransferase [Planctomycetes bacterium]|nr:3-methyl-2-oxobutanoate hydroxymethyltransferase [Planctomycetota bacterium]MCP4838341.1 3-methyl-2-oxobutanoate hydroxymethyltransferase [Planctomycetota bacterium]
MANQDPKPVTLRTLQRMTAEGERFACLTAYDATTARHLERAGIPLLLVGDTAAEMVLGLPGTIHAPLDFMITLTAAVKRGAPNTFVMGDMPFMSYQADEAEGVRNAGRFLTDGTADAVKVEVDGTFTGLVSQMNRAGIPVCAHVGSRPQRAKHDGGYRAAGRTVAEAARVVEDAVRLEDAGACMLLIEATPAEVAQQIVERTSVPVIGCGAGPACHGQIVVTQDIFGLTDWQPAFAKPVTDLAAEVHAAATEWKSKVASGNLGKHPYTMIDGPATTS